MAIGLFLVLQHALDRLGRPCGQEVLVGVAGLACVVDADHARRPRSTSASRSSSSASTKTIFAPECSRM